MTVSYYKRLTSTPGGLFERGLVKNRGPDYAAAAVAKQRTRSYVVSLASLDVAAAVQRLNQDSGYQPAAGNISRCHILAASRAFFDGLRGRRFLGMGQVYRRRISKGGKQ